MEPFYNLFFLTYSVNMLTWHSLIKPCCLAISRNLGLPGLLQYEFLEMELLDQKVHRVQRLMNAKLASKNNTGIHTSRTKCITFFKKKKNPIVMHGKKGANLLTLHFEDFPCRERSLIGV